MTVLVTGATGAIGTAMREWASRRRLDVRLLQLDSNGNAWRLGANADPRALVGADVLMHLAWDFDPAEYERNVQGTQMLMTQARRAGVKRNVFVSSQSAGSIHRTRYGEGKRQIELTLERSDVAVRPGLVWSSPAQGVFAVLTSLRVASRVVTVSSRAVIHPVHMNDLAQVLVGLAEDRSHSGVIEVGNAEPLTVPELVSKALGRPADFVIPESLMTGAARLSRHMGVRGRALADRAQGLLDLQPMRRPLDRVCGVKLRPLSQVVADGY